MATWNRHLPLGAAALTLAAGILVSAQLGRLDIEQRASEERSTVVSELAATRARLEGVIKATFNSTDGLVHLIALQGGIAPGLFADMAYLAIEKQTHIRNITLAPDDQVRFVFPRAGNEKIIGFRYASVPEQYRTVQLARERQAPILAGPIDLVQGGRGLIQRYPIFARKIAAPDQVPRYWGTASIVANVDAILDAGGLRAVKPDLRVALRGKDGKGKDGDIIDGDPALFAQSPVLASVAVAGGEWQLAAVPARGWTRKELRNSPYFLVGLLNTLLLTGIVGLLMSRGRQVRQSNADLAREIEVRRQTEDALREQEQRFHTLFESLPDPVWIIEGNRFVDCNEMAATLLGYPSKGDFLFVHPAQLSPPLQPDGEPSYAKAERMIQLARENGLHRFEWVHTRANGENFPAEVTLRLITLQGREAIYCVWRDITERKRVELDLRESEITFRKLFEDSSDPNLLIDDTGVFVECNQAALDLLKMTREQLLHLPADRISPTRQPDGRLSAEAAPEMLALAYSKGLHRFDWTCVDAEGGEFIVEVSLMPVVIKGQPMLHANWRDITERKASADKIERLAFYDPLTDLPNRRLLLDRLEQALSASARHKQYGALMLLDMDDFKTLNDTLGHDVGDQFLIEVARRLQASVREGDTVARHGGDEFVVILEDLSGDTLAATQVERIAMKILAAVSQPYLLDLTVRNGFKNLRSYHCTSSIGITLFRDNTISVDELMKRADTAMYQAKAAGRNALRFFDPEMQAIVSARAALDNDLREAVQEGQFCLYYQPQVNAAGIRTGAEALLRWRHPRRGMVSPAEFVPQAEVTGLILPLGLWVLDTACGQLRQWAKRPETAHLTLAVNVSARQFRQPDFVKQVLAIIDCNNVDAGRLKLEITESLLLDDVEDIVAKMAALKARGISFALDDFGTGYSSLSYLKRLPLDQLKIDRSFVRDVLTDPNDATIARTIVALARSMGLEVIAEGVESEAQRDFLAANGCTNYQGYLFGRPMPIEEFLPATA